MRNNNSPKVSTSNSNLVDDQIETSASSTPVVSSDKKAQCVQSEPASDPCKEFCFQKSLMEAVPSLAWPLTFLTILFLFKGKVATTIDTLIGLLKDTDSFQYKDSKWVRRAMDKVSSDANVSEIIPEVTAEYFVDKANEQIRYKSFSSLQSSDFIDAPQGKLDIDKIYELVLSHPRSAILESWSVFEMFAQTYIEKKGLSSKKNSTLHNINTLNNNKVFSKDQFRIVNEMRKIRNTVAHSQVSIDEQTANEFVTTVLRIATIVAKKYYSA